MTTEEQLPPLPDGVTLEDLLIPLRAALAQQAQEPVREHTKQDIRCACCGYMTYHREHMGCIRAAPAPLAAYAPNDTLPPKCGSVTKIVPDVAPTRDYLPGMWDESDLLGGATDMPSKPPAPQASEVTDEQNEQALRTIQHLLDSPLMSNHRAGLEAARAILALRPQAVPMTPLEIFSHGPWMFQETGETFTGAQLDEAAFVKCRAHHGITAQGGEGEQ